MNLQEFSNKVLESLQEYFGEGYSGRINKVKKNNGIILTGISVFKSNILAVYCNNVHIASIF